MEVAVKFPAPLLTLLLTGALQAQMVQVSSVIPSSTTATFVFKAPSLLDCAVRVYTAVGALVPDTATTAQQNCGRGILSGTQISFTVSLLEPGRVYRYDIRSGYTSAGGYFATTTSPTTSAVTSGPRFSYISGPSYCSNLPNFPAPANCSAPGELPLGSFPVPPPGSTYKDANFGATIKLLTGGGSNRHAYSTPTVMSATARYALLSDTTFTTIMDTASALPVRQVRRSYRSWTSGEAIWDVVSDDVLYYLSSYWNGTKVVADKLMRYQVSTGTETVVQDYSKAPFNFGHVYRGGTGDMSKDGWLTLLSDTKQLCVIQLIAGRPFYGQTICTSFANVGGMDWSIVDFASISKGPDAVTRMHYIVLQGSPSNAIFQFDSARGILTFQFRPEVPAALTGKSNGNGVCEAGETCMQQAHSDTMEDSQGVQYLVRAVQLASPCSLVISTMRLSSGINMLKPVSQGGGRTDLTTIAYCGATRWPSLHIGCARKAALCSISMENLPASLPAQIRDGAAYNGEIWVVRDNGVEIRRLAMHRSVIQTYFDQPRVSISDDGSKVIWDSNFGIANSTRVVMAETGMR